MAHLILSKIRTLITFLLLRALEALVSVPDRRYKQGPYSKPYRPIQIDPPAIVGNIDKEGDKGQSYIIQLSELSVSLLFPPISF
jgi:hypothetical protein